MHRDENVDKYCYTRGTMAKAKKKKPQATGSIVNRRARFDYELQDELTVGIVLTGPEVRAARDNLAQLKGAYVTIKGNELWLNNASFSVKAFHHKTGEQQAVDTSPRKLLAHRKQIEQLEERKKAGMTIVPVRLLNKSRHIKLVIALGKGKKKYDKRETIKRRDQDRDTKRVLKKFS